MRLTNGENVVDPITGLTIIMGNIRVTQDGKIRTVQATGEPPGGLNTQPGTDPTVPASIAAAPGLPRGYAVMPDTGTLIVNGNKVTG